MIKKILWATCLFMGLSFLSSAQTSPIDSIARKYRDWLTGENVTYNNTSVNDRYNRFLNSGNGARDLSGYDLANPGAIWDFAVQADQSAYERLTEQKLIRLVFLYQLKGPSANPNPAYHSTGLRDTILGIFNYMKAKGINDTTDFEVDVSIPTESISIGEAAALRSSAYATAIFLMKDELVTAGEFAHHLGALGKLSSFIAPGNPDYHFTWPGFNTDGIRAIIQQRLCYVLAQDDTSSTRSNNMVYLKDFINNALLTGYGWSDCIKPDGMTYHHRGVYSNSYGANGLVQASILNRILKHSPYQLTSIAEQNIKHAVLNYRKFCIDFTMPRGLAGRFPTATAAFDDVRPALAYLYIADPVTNAEAGQEFLRLWTISATANTSLQRANLLSINMIHSLGGMQDMVNTLNAGLTPATELTTGQFGFPYAGLSVHKYNGWQASMKGTSKHIWHYEKSATENLFGQYTAAGAMELLARGNPVTPDSNGLSFNGWDWAHIPGTTVANLPFSIMAGSTARQMNGKNFLAHANLGDKGVFAMDYKDINSATGMTALKTAFFFKDMILCLGSDIKDAGGQYPIHTTLFQTAFPAGNTSLVNGNIVAGNTYTFSQPGGPFWATDAVGNGFVIPANSYNNNIIAIQRASQTSPNQSNTANTTGDFAKAYIDHGTAPAAATYQYAIVMQAAANTQDLANNFASYFQVLKQDSQAHIVQYIPDSVYSYVVWDTNAVLPAGGLLQKADKPSVTMLQLANGGHQLNLSLTNPDLGLLTSGEAYTYSQINSTASRLYRIPQTTAVKLKLAGNWQLQSPMTNVSAVPDGSNTDITFNTINGLTIEAVLVKVIQLPVTFQQATVQSKDCRNLLQWQYAGNSNMLRNITIDKSTDGGISWQQIAVLPPAARQYTDASNVACWYRIAATGTDNSKSYYHQTLRTVPQKGCTDIPVYPNPSQGKFYLRISEPGTSDIHIFDLAGSNITAQVNIRYHSAFVEVDLKNFPAGTYYIKTRNNTYKVTKL